MTKMLAPRKRENPIRTYTDRKDGSHMDSELLDPRDVWIRACREFPEPEVFDPTSPREYEAAVEVCAGCPIAAECGRWAVRNHEWGVWGGRLYERGRDAGPKRPPGRPRKAVTAA